MSARPLPHDAQAIVVAMIDQEIARARDALERYPQTEVETAALRGELRLLRRLSEWASPPSPIHDDPEDRQLLPPPEY